MKEVLVDKVYHMPFLLQTLYVRVHIDSQQSFKVHTVVFLALQERKRRHTEKVLSERVRG